MKTNLLTFIILYNVIFVVSRRMLDNLPGYIDTSELYTDNDSFIFNRPVTEGREKNTEDEFVTPENPSTTEHNIETIAPNYCAKGQSYYSKQDLVAIVNLIAEQLNIEANITSAYHQLAVNINDKLSKELKDDKDKTRDRPQHLNDVLDDIENNRKTKLAVLFQTANASLQQLPELETQLKMLDSKTMNIENDIKDIKQLCRINKCPEQQMHNYKSAMENNETDKTLQGDDYYFCSNVATLQKTVVDRLLGFEADAMATFKQEVINKQKVLEKDISIFMKELKNEIVSRFGVSMYDILSLMDDQFHIEASLKKFIDDSTIDIIKKKNAEIEYSLVVLDPKMQRKRQICRTCQQVQRSGYYNMTAYEFLNKKIIETTTENDTNLLNQLIDDKINEINKKAQTDFDNIFSNITSSVAEESNVRETIRNIVLSTNLVRDEVIERTDQAKKALKALMESASEESRENAGKLLEKAQKLTDFVSKISDTVHNWN